MTYRGTIRNGSVVLEPGVEFPDGVEVEVALAAGVPAASLDLDAERRQLWRALRALPKETTFEDVVEQVYLLFKIERGVRQLDAGEGIPHEEARRRSTVKNVSRS